jgi:hypothetical protein
VSGSVKKPQRPDRAAQVKRTASSPVMPGRSPLGVALAVIFDWSLAVQLLTMPFLAALLNLPPPVRLAQLDTAANVLLSLLLALPFAGLIAFFGEGLRRGRRWVRSVQLAFNTLLSLAGLATLYTLWQGLRVGNYWPLVMSLLLLVFSPLVIWQLLRPATIRWFAPLLPEAEADEQLRRRLGYPSPWPLLLWSIPPGLLEALASLHR